MSAATTIRLRADIQRMADRTAELKREATDLFARLKPEQWTWSPNSNTWSIALIVEHLNTVARPGLPPIEETLARLRAEGSTSDVVPRYGLLERFFIRLLSPNPPFKVPVPPVYLPKLAADPTKETGPEFLTLMDRTLACVQSANGLDLTKLKIASPANEKMKLSVGAWLEGNIAHNEYHWVQVRALHNHADFPRN